MTLRLAPLTPTEILTALKGAGLDIYEMPGWRDRCRCHTGSHELGVGRRGVGWGPTRGVMWHHTAGPMLAGQAAIDYTRNILIDGNGSTVGPLCLAGIDADGRILLVGAGRANHAGGISQAALDALQDGTLGTAGNRNLRGSGVDGNTYTVGWEILAPGAPNAAQRAAGIKATAAILQALGLRGTAVIGHGEGSDQRDWSDPGLDMGTVRRDVTALLADPARPLDPLEEDMPITDSDVQRIAKAVLDSYTTPRGHGLLAQAAAKGITQTGVPAVLGRIAAAQGVNTKDLAAALAATLTPTIRAAVLDAAKQGGTPDAVADAVVARLGDALTQ